MCRVRARDGVSSSDFVRPVYTAALCAVRITCAVANGNQRSISRRRLNRDAKADARPACAPPGYETFHAVGCFIGRRLAASMASPETKMNKWRSWILGGLLVIFAVPAFAGQASPAVSEQQTQQQAQPRARQRLTPAQRQAGRQARVQRRAQVRRTQVRRQRRQARRQRRARRQLRESGTPKAT